jgi:hypothetical protein
MMPSQQYRLLAADLRRRAAKDTDAASRVEWETLATLYDRLAMQADQNGRADELYEPILKPRDKPGTGAR